MCKANSNNKETKKGLTINNLQLRIKNYELIIKELEEQIEYLKEREKNLLRMGRDRKMNVLLSYETLTECQFLLEEEIKESDRIHGKVDIKKLSKDDDFFLMNRSLNEINNAVEGFD